VRVIDYTIADPGRPQTAGATYRLVTTILDPAHAPVAELAALYAERWEIESIFDELETLQRGLRMSLCSGTPPGVYQAAWGHLRVDYAIRALIAAENTGGHNDPDRLSFHNRGAARHAAQRVQAASRPSRPL